MHGLLPLKPKTALQLLKGKIDFSHAKTFGAIDINVLPPDHLLVSSILNQGPYPKCTAYSACAVQESQHNIRFDPDDFYNQEAIINGGTNPDGGYDLRTAMSTGIKYGFLPVNGGNPADYKEGGYFLIDGAYDLFDNIRVALWMAKEEKKCAVVGTMWYAEWSLASNGIIDKELPYGTKTGNHAIKCAGWKTINGKPYLVIQNSYGSSYGDGGLFYFSRDVVNAEFGLGHYIWRSEFEEAEIRKTQWRIIALALKVIELLKQLLKLK
jgi:hypothetical protein